MPYQNIIYTRKDHIAHMTLNLPEAGNAINQPLARELSDVCRQINQDDSIYAVIITGAGKEAFCSGSELEQLAQAGGADKATGTKLTGTSAEYRVASAVASLDRVVIGAINGNALGQGLELALSCDIRIASNKARFGFPQVALGLIPMDGGTQRLPRIVGKGKALEMVLTAGIISADEALEIGLVSKVVDEENLSSEAEAMAKIIAGKGPVALRYIKEAVNKGLDLTMEQGLRLEADLYFILHTTADRTEGIKAFLEKRPPQFKGQ